VPHPIVKHVDTEVFISAFIPDDRDRIDKNDAKCLSFLTKVLSSEPNTRLRVSFTALGELLYVYATRRDYSTVSLTPFLEYAMQMGNRFEPYSPELKGHPKNLHEALKTAGDCCEKGKTSHADAMIVAYALVDSEAVSLYTQDRHMLNCPILNERIRQFREEHDLSTLRIREI